MDYQELRNKVEELQRIAAAADATVKAAETVNRPLVAQLKVVRDHMAQYQQRQREIGVTIHRCYSCLNTNCAEGRSRRSCRRAYASTNE